MLKVVIQAPGSVWSVFAGLNAIKPALAASEISLLAAAYNAAPLPLSALSITLNLLSFPCSE